MKKMALIFAIITLSGSAFSHPGRTASDGCHYCRTNCDYWGVPYGARHCHFKQEPTKDELKFSEIIKQVENDREHFITVLHDDVYTTFEVKNSL